MMSSSRSASVKINSTSSSSSESIDNGAYVYLDSASCLYTRLSQKYETVENRIYYLRNRLFREIERRNAHMNKIKNVIRPPMEEAYQQASTNYFISNKVDCRLYSEVASCPASSSKLEPIVNYPITNINKKFRVSQYYKQLIKAEIKLNKIAKQRSKINLRPNSVYDYELQEQFNEPYADRCRIPILQPNQLENTSPPFRKPLNRSIKSVKNKCNKASINTSYLGTYNHTPKAVRDIRLIKKLRYIIKRFRNPYYVFKDPITYAMPQMDAHGEENIVDVDKKYNTAISSQREASMGSSDKVITAWHSLTASDRYTSYDVPISRWSKFKTLKWDSNGVSLSQISIMSDILTELSQTPLFMPFRNHRYWKGDISLKFLLNSNKFQVGSLQISYLYGVDMEYQCQQFRNTVFNLSQTNHCILNAGSSNEGELFIPFKYHNPIISTYQKDNVDYAKVFINPINDLIAVSSTYNTASLTIFVSLSNCQFVGTLDSTLVTSPQMFHIIRAICKTTEFGLNQLDPDSNRDNPPDVIPPSMVYLANAPSWSHGSKISEPIHALRLIATGQTPHPNLNYEEMTTKQISRVFGLIDVITWSSSKHTGELIWSMEAAPMAKLSSYRAYLVSGDRGKVSLRALPPIAVLSSLFAYWRGSLELRIDVVASQFHTGSFLVAYIPGYLKSVTLDQARSSNYVICNIQEQQSFNIQIPYIADSPVWQRKYNPSIQNKAIQPPGMVHMFVLNDLIPNDQVPKEVYLNIYIRAGDDFEFLVPIQSNISTPYNLSYRDDTINKLVPAQGMSGNNFSGNVIKFVDGSSKFYCLAIPDPNTLADYQKYSDWRDGLFDTSSGLSNLLTILSEKVSSPNFYIRLIYLNSFKYGILYKEKNGSTGVDLGYMLYIAETKDKAEIYVNTKQTFADMLNATLKPDDKALSVLFRSIPNFYMEKIFVKPPPKPKDMENEFVVISHPQNEERQNAPTTLSMTDALSSTNDGNLLFGEDFKDLKDYCRRYQLYCVCTTTIPNFECRKQGSCIIPILPQGVLSPITNPDKSINHVFNRCKDGFIPLLASGYRFYRGSLRVRIVVHGIINGNIWVQHRPEAMTTNLEVTYISTIDQKIYDYFNHGYAYVIQNLAHNNVLNLEVPWYSKNMLAYSFLPRTSFTSLPIFQPQSAFSLGNLIIGIDVGSDKISEPNFNFEVYYSLADDFHFNTFQGFPLMMVLKDIPDTVADPQMGLFSLVKGSNNIVNTAEGLMAKSSNTIDRINDALSQLPSLISENFASASSTIKTLLFDCFSHLVHSIINPTIATISWAISSMLVKLGVITHDYLLAFSKLVTSLFKVFVKKEDTTSEESNPAEDCIPSSSTACPQQHEGDYAYPNSDSDDASEIAGSIGSILWGGLIALLSVKGKIKNTGYKNFTSHLINGLSSGISSANLLFRFLKNNFTFLEKCYKYIINKTYSSYNRYLRLSIEHSDLLQWLTLSEKLLQPINYSLIANNLRWREALYSTTRYGHLYFCQELGKKSPRIDAYIRKVHNELVLLRDSLQREKLFPSLRQEAFGLWINGEPGIGKSSLVPRLVTDLLHFIHYKGASELIFNLNPTDKYWTGCDQQPVILIDDAFAVTSPEATQSQLWAYFQVMSPVPLIPPMAELKDKKMHYNPEIFVTCSNNAFPKLCSLAVHEALYRRRHFLIDTALVNPEIKSYPYGLSKTQVDNLEHLKFRLALVVTDPSTSYTDYMSYSDLIKLLCSSFQEFKIRTEHTYNIRKQLQFSFWPEDSSPEIDDIQSINSYLKEVDKHKEVRFSNVQTDFGSVTEVNQALELVRSYLIENKQQHLADALQTVKLLDTKFVEPQSPISDLMLSEEELAAELAECEKLEDQVKEITSDNIKVKELKEYNKEFDLQAPYHDNFLMLEYQGHYSNMISTIVSCCVPPPSYKDKTNFLRQLTIDQDWHRINEILNSHIENKSAPFINKVDKTPHYICLHNFLDKYSTLVKREINGYIVEVWAIKCYRAMDLLFTTRPMINKYTTTTIYVSDIPCYDNHCMVIHNNPKWRAKVAEWYQSNLYSTPSLLKSCRLPIVLSLRRNLSKLKTGFHFIHLYLEKIIKVGIYDILYKTCHWFGSIATNVSVFLTGLALLLGVSNYMRSPAPQLISSGDTSTRSFKNPFSRSSQVVFSRFNVPPSPQQGNSSCLSEVIMKRIKDNTVFIVYKNEKLNKTSCMKCIILKSNYLLILKHYHEYLISNYDNSEVYLSWPSGYLSFDVKKYNVHWCDNSNYGILKLTDDFQKKKSIIHFIARNKQLQTLLGPTVRILDIHEQNTNIYHEQVQIHNNLCIAPTSYSKSLLIPSTFKYSQNYPGMCGSIVLCDNISQNPIIGFHVAGSNGYGYAEPVCRELFDEYFKQVESSSTEELTIVDWRELSANMLPISESKLILTGSHNYLGTLDNTLAKAESGITSIIPSTISPVFPIVTEPAPLSPKDPRIQENPFSPMLAGCEKHCNITLNFNDIHLTEAYEDLNSLILANCKPMRLTVDALNECESINGLQMDGYEPMVMNTSEGFPLSRFRPPGAINKKWLFKFENDKVQCIHPLLREILDSKHNDRLNSIVPLTIHDDCLKDSRISLKKITTPGKTRVFSISPVDFTIQFRQYFLDFIASYKQSRFAVEHAVGINVHGLEWTDLANKFKDKKVITGDYSGFGPSLNSLVLRKAFQIIINWYIHNNCNLEDTHIRKVMVEELVNSKHIMLNYYYQVLCGMPSGNPATVVLNSLCNSIYVRCAWLDIMSNTLYNSLLDFRHNTTLITYGDDLIMSVSNETVDKFNNNSLSEFFFKHKIIFTDAAKTGTHVAPWIKFEDATFLKHSFNKHPYREGVYIAALDKDSITECANWIRKSIVHPKEATRDNVIQGTMLAYGHGPEFFNAYVETLKKIWLDKYQEELVCRTWRQLDELFLDTGYYFDW